MNCACEPASGDEVIERPGLIFAGAPLEASGALALFATATAGEPANWKWFGSLGPMVARPNCGASALSFACCFGSVASTSAASPCSCKDVPGLAASGNREGPREGRGAAARRPQP